MSSKTANRTLYKTPFSKAYWKDAAAELKSTRMLVITALLIALRVATKTIYIPLAPGLNINLVAPLINATGAMIFGPVMAALAACVSDVLGYIVAPQGGVFYLPYTFVEVAGSVLFALFFYRAKMTVTRVIAARFSMDLFVNIIINSLVSMSYYKFILGKSYTAMIIPAVIKNLCMFPLESFALAIFLAAIVPVCYRMGLTHDPDADKDSLKFSKRQVISLVVLFVVAACAVFGYLFYYYNNTSLSSKYSTEERYFYNTSMDARVHEADSALAGVDTVTIIDSAYKKYMAGETTYNVTVYSVNEDALQGYSQGIEAIRGMSRSKAKAVSDDGVMDFVYTAVIVMDTRNDTIKSYTSK